MLLLFSVGERVHFTSELKNIPEEPCNNHQDKNPEDDNYKKQKKEKIHFDKFTGESFVAFPLICYNLLMITPTS